MKFILLTCALVFALGSVYGCNLERKQKCIDAYKRATEDFKNTIDKCLRTNDVRQCVFINAECSSDDANAAASDMANDLGLNCNKDPTWEMMGRCLTRFAECEQTYNKTVHDVQDKTEICKALEDFQKCASSECGVLPINYEVSRFMRRDGVESCENINFQICESFEQLETCVVQYNEAVMKLDVKKNPEAKCRLIEAVEQCLRKKANCIWEITRRIMKELLSNLDCSKYGILCDQKSLEDCTLSHPKFDDCGKVKAFGDCINKTANCPEGPLDNILKQVMEENSLDCDSFGNDKKTECDCQKSTEL